MIMIVVMTVTPIPILLLLVVIEPAEISIVAMIFHHPLLVVDILVAVPAVIIVVIGIVGAIMPFATAGGQYRSEKCGC